MSESTHTPTFRAEIDNALTCLPGAEALAGCDQEIQDALSGVREALHAAKAASATAIDLPADLVTAIDSYLASDWSKERDPSRLGALNAVAYIGERVAAIRKATGGEQ